MKKSLLLALSGLFLLSACSGGGAMKKRHGYDSEACRMKCQRLGQHVAVTASGNSGKCICTEDSSSFV